MFTNLEFIKPYYFLLVFFAIFLVYLFYRKQKKGIKFLFLEDVKKVFQRNSYKFYFKIFIFICILWFYIILLADPNDVNSKKNITKNGIDIVLAFDVSVSMEATDLSPNRMEAAKEVINKFIKNQKTDRLWLVIFAWKPFTSIPLTFDYNILSENISRLSTQTINQNTPVLNWTAIWDALLMSKTLFKKTKNMTEDEYKKRQKVVILLTDWDSNTWVDPKIASISLWNENIKVYTIGIWSDKWWKIRFDMWNGIYSEQIVPPLNPESLKEIAQNTSGEFFKATDNDTFKNIFSKLSKLEKNDIKVDVTKIYTENYDYFLYWLILVLFVFILII